MEKQLIRIPIKKITAKLESFSAIYFGRYHETEKEKGESPEKYEIRTWREKAHYDKEGYVVIPGQMFHKALPNAASYRGEKIKGRGNLTWLKFFKAGILIKDDLRLFLKREDLNFLRLFAPIPGKDIRIWRYFPCVPQWKGTMSFYILDPQIDLECFKNHLITLGRFIGLGSLRVGNGGLGGRFSIIDIKEEETTEI